MTEADRESEQSGIWGTKNKLCILSVSVRQQLVAMILHRAVEWLIFLPC